MRILRTAVPMAAAVALLCTGLAACGSAGSKPGGAAGSGASSGAMVPAASQNVSFDADGTTTYGTLEIPAHRGGQRLAAALLLAGSGPTDRDGNQSSSGINPDTLELIAGVLDKMGIMTLRFDKYFSGQTGGGTYASDPGSITLTQFIDQADDAYKFLGSQPSADPAKLLVVGHSEGGMYALEVADSVSPKPAGLGLIEPQDEPILSLLELQTDEQIEAAAQQGQLTAADAQQQEQLVQQAISEFRAGQTVDTTGMLSGIESGLAPIILTPGNAAYTRTDDAVNPPTLAAKLPAGTRVLVTDGTADRNVPPSTIGPLVTALQSAGTTGPGLQSLDGLDHYLHTSSMSTNTQQLAPAAISAIQAWAQPYAGSFATSS
jgi:uncharacterized protein